MFDFLLPSSPEAAGKPVTFLGFFDPRSKHQNIPTPAKKNPITVQPNTNTLVVISPPPWSHCRTDQAFTLMALSFLLQKHPWSTLKFTLWVKPETLMRGVSFNYAITPTSSIQLFHLSLSQLRSWFLSQIPPPQESAQQRRHGPFQNN